MSDPPAHSRPDPPETAPTKADGRRAFLRAAIWGGGIAGAGGLAGYGASRISRQTRPRSGPKPVLGDEFTYDVKRFQKTDPDLLRHEELRRFEAGIRRPRNLAVDPQGAILVVGDGGIRKLTEEGATVWTRTLARPAYSVAPRGEGEILVGLAGAIVVLDAGGGEVATWGGFPENFLPTAIAVAGQQSFVADAGSRVVRRVDASGKQLAVIGERDPERNVRGFSVPSPYFCVRLAPDGLLRITNPGAHRIEAFTIDGSFELAWGQASFAVEGFCGCCNPVSFDIFPDGSFVTCEKGLPRVKLYDVHGEFTGLVAGPEAFPEYLQAANAGSPDSLGSGIFAAIDPEDRVVVLDVVSGTIRIMKRKEPRDA